MSDLEIDRARKQAPHCAVLSLSRYQRRLRRDGIKRPGFAEVIPALLRERGIRRVVVPQDFPCGLAADLQRRGIAVKPRPGHFFPEREHKSAAEVKKLSAAAAHGRDRHGGGDASAAQGEDHQRPPAAPS